MNETHFINGHEILEPKSDQNDFEFEGDNTLYKHALEHLVALHDRERWDDLDFFQRNDFHRALKNDLLQKVCQESVMPIIRTTPIPTYCNKRKEKRKQFEPWANDDDESCEEEHILDVKLTKENCEKLQGIPEFVELVKVYQVILVQVLKGCVSNNFPHYHVLKVAHVLKFNSSTEHQPFKQIIKVLDSRNGIIVIANVTYSVDTQTGFQHFDKGNKYVIVSGYRFWRSKTQFQRERKFARLEKELHVMELVHDRKFQKVVGVQKHFPPDEQYYSQNIGEEITL